MTELARIDDSAPDDAEFHLQVVRILGKSPPAAGTLNPLLARMGARDGDVAKLAGETLLARAGFIGAADVPKLASIVNSSNDTLSLFALRCLGAMGREAAKAVPEMRTALGGASRPFARRRWPR